MSPAQNLKKDKETRTRMSEASIRRCSLKYVFLNIWQNSQKSTGARVSFLLKRLFIKKETLAQLFHKNLKV